MVNPIPSENAVELLATSRYLDHPLSLMSELHRGHEACRGLRGYHQQSSRQRTFGLGMREFSNVGRTGSFLSDQAFCNSFLDLLNLDFAKPLDLEKGFAGCRVDGLCIFTWSADTWWKGHGRGVSWYTYGYSEITIGFEFGDVCGSNALMVLDWNVGVTMTIPTMSLDPINVDDEVL